MGVIIRQEVLHVFYNIVHAETEIVEEYVSERVLLLLLHHLHHLEWRAATRWSGWCDAKVHPYRLTDLKVHALEVHEGLSVSHCKITKSVNVPSGHFEPLTVALSQLA